MIAEGGDAPLRALLELRLPKQASDRPAPEFLEWHNENVFVA